MTLMIDFCRQKARLGRMKIETHMTDDQLLNLMGERLAQLRLARNLTQAELAAQAGLGLRTVRRVELGTAAIQLSGFVRICRVLGLLEGLEVLLPEVAASPIEQLKLQGRKRRRASRRKEPAVGEGKAWTWGETP
jgi:transcriptional regulator with XRE-family HTH domain